MTKGKPKPRTVKNADEIKACLAMRAAGYSMPSIAEKLGVSLATQSRIYAKFKAGKGSLTESIIEESRQKLLSDGAFTDDLKRRIASILLDDASQFDQQRRALYECVDNLMLDNTLPAHYKLRGLAAAAVTLKTTSETIRKSLGIDKVEPEAKDLPELTISELTAADIQAMRKSQLMDSRFVGNDSDIMPFDLVEADSADDIVDETR